MAKFDLKGLLNDRSVPDRQQDQKIVYRNPEDLIPSEDNFYNTEKLELLKQSIKLLGILQPLLIENRDGKDYVIAGHCRRKCCIDLIQEGNDKFSRIPCIYKTSSELEQDAGQGDEIVRQIMLIQANVYREKTDWEKMTEVLTMESLLTELRKKVPMQGRSRKILKDISKTSAGQLGRYHTISRHLCEQLMSEFKEDRIKISVAYEAARLSEEYQKQACEMYAETGILTLSDIEGLYRQQEAEKGIPGQMSIETATGQNRPPEDDTEIPAETQIERFYESTNKNMKNYIIQEDKNMTIFMLSNLYGTARVRNGHLNYQGSTAGITFNPGGVFEHELSWQSLAKILISKYGHKKPVKMVSIDAPERKKNNTSEERCQPAAETPDEKQHDFVEGTKIADHPGETTEMPRNKPSGIGIRTNGISITYDSWPPELKNIPLPTESEMVGYLYDEEQKLKEILDKEKESPWITQKEITKQQLIVGGLRLVKKFIEECQK